MTTALINQNGMEAYEAAIVQGDLEHLSVEDRLTYYRKLCESLGLNPLSQPFGYLKLSGRLTLYAKKDAAEQLRRKHNVSIWRLDRESIGDLYVVTAYARLPDGREDSDMGASHLRGKSGDDLVNAMLKAVTKAKRRVTLSICGLGMLDESEIESIQGATIEYLHDEYQQGTPAIAVRMITPSQQRDIMRVGSEKRLSKSAIIDASVNRFGVTVRELTEDQAATLVTALEKLPMPADELPIDEPDANPAKRTPPLANQKQIEAIYEAGGVAGYDAPETDRFCAARYDGRTVASLTSREASDLLTILREG